MNNNLLCLQFYISVSFYEQLSNCTLGKMLYVLQGIFLVAVLQLDTGTK